MKAMRTGLLIHDDKGTLEDRVGRAARLYRRKHGTQPTVCYVNPAALSEPLTVGGVRVEAKSTVLVDHFWIGEEPSNDI